MDTDLILWWSTRSSSSAVCRDLWTVLILVFWCIWMHQNNVVFNGVTPVAGVIKSKIREEFERWRLAGLFRTDSFSFPLPLPLWLLDGD
jgi:hypothetical protein